MYNTETVIRLIEQLQSIVSEGRSSLSVSDVNLLKDCINFLETVRDSGKPVNVASDEIVSNVIVIFLRVLFSGDFDN